MLPGKILLAVKLLLCFLALAAEGKKKKNRKNQESNDEPANPTVPSLNMCDTQNRDMILCYCDKEGINEATEGNCWIFDNTSEKEEIWEGFVSQTGIKKLTFHIRQDGTLKDIPTTAILHLSSLQNFEVQYATINSIQSYSFGNSSTLNVISLSRNSIASLARNAFAHLPQLIKLNLGENHITEINRHVFIDLPNLEKLYLNHNNISIVHDRAFRSLHVLKELDLFSNQIKAITPDTFKGLAALEILDLHENSIEVIGDDTFSDLRSLKELNLQANSLKYIAPNGLKGLDKLYYLNLQDNKLQSLGPEIFTPVVKLYHLDLRNNVLDSLTEATMTPLIQNLNNKTMLFFLEGNKFRCDDRMAWALSLHNSTASRTVQRHLDSVVCYMESGLLPLRLQGTSKKGVGAEASTLGIGPPVKLLDLQLSELPDANRELPDCPLVEESERSAVRHRSSHPHKTNRRNEEEQQVKAQNDMAAIAESKEVIAHEDESMVDPQESRSYDGSGAPGLSEVAFQSLLTASLVAVLLPLRLH
ncbi:uncharacterized protein LOC143025637 isoform X2 [Oratosquilla oratoria]|uniref:uncharacterized protein LOC143025637 isoform X2 n=1 Tax=Oratosquilla oratoria TaxID=337810 RepID=UPI003F76DA15